MLAAPRPAPHRSCYFALVPLPLLEQDIRLMNDQALKAAPRRTGAIILGGGVPKHHICNANLMRNGADFAVFLNTAQVHRPTRLDTCCKMCWRTGAATGCP